VSLDRVELSAKYTELVRHVWVVRWRLPVGEVSQQRVLTYPAFNLIFSDQSATLYGPNPKVSVQTLSGQGWALGLLLRPAAGPLLTSTSPRRLLAQSEPMPGAPTIEIAAAMARNSPPSALTLIEAWLGPYARRVGSAGRLVNRVCRVVEEDRTLVRVVDVARRVGVSTRSLERLIMAHVGVTPKWLIECRRLQEAATTLFARPETPLTELALDLGYVDYAHFYRRYKAILAETPNKTRTSAQIARRPHGRQTASHR